MRARNIFHDVQRVAAAKLRIVRPPQTDLERFAPYRNDPAGFARDFFGVELWSRQREFVESALRFKRIACCSGHKTGKSRGCAILALWFYCCFPGVRVVLSAPGARQVDGIIWREIRTLIRTARNPIPGAKEIHELARSGLVNPETLAEIKGYTAKDVEAIAGISGETIVYIVDEASGVPGKIFQAIEGNRAGGNAWLILISNPTRADGEFYEAFTRKRLDQIGDAGYHTLKISSRESPNVTGELGASIPGLASPTWIAEKIQEHGEDSAFVKIRIDGDFAVAEEARVFPLGLLEEAQARWEDTPPTGRLVLGCDPAGDGDEGDETAIVARRGNRVLEIRTRRASSPEATIADIGDMISTHAARGKNGRLQELPLVVCDSEGETSYRVYARIREHAERTSEFALARVRSSQKAFRSPELYDRVADELYANARQWMREGGAIPTNARLEQDLHVCEFKTDIRGRLKLTPKKERRILLGRSPDIGDAFALSCWVPAAERDGAPAVGGVPSPPKRRGGEVDDDNAVDPYGGGGIDPYG